MAGSGTLSTIVMSLSWGHSCGFLGVSLALGFSLARKWPFLSKHLFCYPPPRPQIWPPTTSSTQLAQPGPSEFLSLHPQTPAPSLHRRSFLLPLPRETLYPSLGLPCYLSSLGLLKHKHLEESLPSRPLSKQQYHVLPSGECLP